MQAELQAALDPADLAQYAIRGGDADFEEALGGAAPAPGLLNVKAVDGKKVCFLVAWLNSALAESNAPLVRHAERDLLSDAVHKMRAVHKMWVMARQTCQHVPASPRYHESAVVSPLLAVARNGATMSLHLS